MRASPTRWLALPLLCGLLACADMGEESPRPCESNSDCASGEICFEDGCASALDFAVRVTPLNTSGLTIQDFNSVSVAMGSVELGLKRPGLIEGTVYVKGDTTFEEYAAVDGDSSSWFVVQARGRSSNIPGLAFEQPLSKIVKAGSSISLTVPAGLWDISVTPTNTRLPAVFARTTVAPGERVDPEIVLVTGTRGLLNLEGFVVKTPTVAWPTAAPTLRIQAIDPSNGTPLSQAVTYEASAQEPFSLHALKIDSPVVLRVGPDASSLVPAPTKELRSADDGTFPSPLVLELGDYGELVDVKGRITSADGISIEGADVRIEGRVRGGGTFTASALSRADGEFSVKLFPTQKASDTEAATRYTLTASPPFASPYAATTITFVVDAATTLPPVICGPKALLTGTVLGTLNGKQRQPLPNVLVQFEGNPASPNPGASKGGVHTDRFGIFSAKVEPGSYRLIAKPAPEHQLPWVSKRVSTSEPFVELHVSDPREVLGKVTDWDGKPVANAVVRFYRVPSYSSADESPPAPPTVYETVTGSEGEFVAIVPKAPDKSEDS
ncbi:MAG: carboxypeptidase-like regulatory domain-containing protein [Myxococcales bacterium]|jgi:hypothetical protein